MSPQFCKPGPSLSCPWRLPAKRPRGSSSPSCFQRLSLRGSQTPPGLLYTIKSLLTPYSPFPAHPYKVSESEKSQLVNETYWQYYGTSDTRGNLSLTWNTSLLPVPAVTIELWGYEETGGACQRLLEVLRTLDTGEKSCDHMIGKETPFCHRPKRGE